MELFRNFYLKIDSQAFLKKVFWHLFFVLLKIDKTPTFFSVLVQVKRPAKSLSCSVLAFWVYSYRQSSLFFLGPRPKASNFFRFNKQSTLSFLFLSKGKKQQFCSFSTNKVLWNFLFWSKSKGQQSLWAFLF